MLCTTRVIFVEVVIFYLKIIICENNIFIPSILQSYVLHWYNMYLFHTEMDRIETNIHH